jgi:hypothetical protein
MSFLDRLLYELFGSFEEPKRQPKRVQKKNPVPVKASERKALRQAQKLSMAFHGTDTEVIKLSNKERMLPQYVVALGEVPSLTYEPREGSSRDDGTWTHEAGDRGPGEPKSPNKPMLAINPRTKKPVIVPMRSPMRFTKRGLIG